MEDSVQDNIEKVFKKNFKRKNKISGAGRTDKEVHAFSQFANFYFKKEINNKKAFSIL